MENTIMMTVNQTADWLKERDNYLILTHRRPDGDTLGCAGALAQSLLEQGKTAYILFNPEVTPRYARFVEDHFAPEAWVPDHIITIDTASYDLFPKNGEEYIDNITLCIDHHPSNTYYAEYTYIDSTAASCGEIIYNLIVAMGGSINVKIAERLYVALSTDTGCFAFANTTANTLRTAALLIEAGASYRELNKELFRTRTLGRIKIEGMIFSGLEFYCDGAVAISSISRKMIEASNATEDDLDDIASIPGSVQGVHVGVTIRELTSESDCKVSIRTGALVNAHSVCAHFGGGGHPMAAGFSMEKSIAEIKAELLEVLKEELGSGEV